ncbi:protein kinase [Kitasatospora sp. NPDC094011]|uniref:protein kinase domain-containing protein n=1 Tax=Kitasatospora sp. NPDC094011 TaxID=3364090 RepID=UPI0037F36415
MSSAGTVLGGRYTLVEKVGGGGMGAVWRAEDQVLARPVAVKILRADLFEDDTSVQRFRREAQLVAAVDHPGIVGVHDYGESGAGGSDDPGASGDDTHCAYIVMDLIEGRPLNQVLKEDGPMSAERALGLLADALDALHAAHRRGIVHRDLKPSNLMVREDGGVVITDFGIARAVASTKLTAPYAIIGTAAYMSPEQASGETTGPASDLYSIGVVGYELLVGQVPYLGEGPLQVALKHVNQPVPELPETFPAAVRALVATALAKRPEDRFESAAGMASAARVAIGLPGTARRAANTGTIDLRAGAGAGAEVAAVGGAAPAAPEQVVKVDPQADTEPGKRRSRRTLLIPIVIPVVISMGTATALLIDRGAGGSDAAAGTPTAQPTVVVTVPAAAAGTGQATTAPATGSASATPQPTDAPSTAPAAAQPPAGGQLPPGGQQPVPAQGGNGGGPGRGGSGSGGGAGNAAGGNGGGGNGAGAGTGQGGGAAPGGSSGGQANPPAGGGGSAAQPPAGSGNSSSQGGSSGGSSAGGTSSRGARPSSCEGSSWSTIVSVKHSSPIGMRNDNLNGDNPLVLGGASQYGWVRSTDPGAWTLFNACNNGGPQLVQTMDGKVVLSNGFSFLTRWSVRSGSTAGSYTLGDYQHQSCMTDNGPGSEITMVTCTPGNTAQEWWLQ